MDAGVEEGRTARPRRMPVRAMATVAAREMRVVWSKRSGGRVSENAILSVVYAHVLGRERIYRQVEKDSP